MCLATIIYANPVPVYSSKNGKTANLSDVKNLINLYKSQVERIKEVLEEIELAKNQMSNQELRNKQQLQLAINRLYSELAHYYKANDSFLISIEKYAGVPFVNKFIYSLCNH